MHGMCVRIVSVYTVIFLVDLFLLLLLPLATTHEVYLKSVAPSNCASYCIIIEYQRYPHTHTAHTHIHSHTAGICKCF